MTDFPASAAFSIPTEGSSYTNANFEADIKQFLAATKQLPGAAGPEFKQIVSGTINPTRFNCRLVPESGTTDVLERIMPDNMPQGALLMLWQRYPEEIVTVKHNAVLGASGIGAIYLRGGADFVCDTPTSVIILQRRANVWAEIYRSVGDTPTRGQTVFTSSGIFTVPEGVDTVYVTAIGGGGGGGGGAGSGDGSADGALGSYGAGSTFGDLLTVSGGNGGAGGKGSGRGGAPAGSGIAGGCAFGLDGGYGACSPPTALGGPGRGGPGGNGANAIAGTAGGGGASGSCSTVVLLRAKVTGLVEGQQITVTVGAGGTGGAGGVGTERTGSNGLTGVAGRVIVEW